MKKNMKMTEARKPKDRQYGKHTFKGVRYDRNGNPIYTSDTLSDEEKKSMGWRYSKKHGLHGQVSDPSKFNESKKRIVKLTESDLHNIVMESVNRILKEDGFYADELYGLGGSFESAPQDTSNQAPWWYTSFENFQKRVNSGKYDKYIFDDGWVEEFIDEEYPCSSQEREMMEKCISERRWQLKQNR